MDRQRFFELIDAAREGVEDTEGGADADALQNGLEPLPDEDLLGFARAFDDELVRLNRWSVWGAGAAASGGLSAEGFHAFRCWLIGKGRAAVDTALTDPDGLDAFLHGGPVENEPIESVAQELLDERDLPDPRLEEGRPPADGDPEGAPFEEDDLPRRFPRITARVAEPEST